MSTGPFSYLPYSRRAASSAVSSPSLQTACAQQLGQPTIQTATPSRSVRHSANPCEQPGHLIASARASSSVGTGACVSGWRQYSGAASGLPRAPQSPHHRRPGCVSMVFACSQLIRPLPVSRANSPPLRAKPDAPIPCAMSSCVASARVTQAARPLDTRSLHAAHPDQRGN